MFEIVFQMFLGVFASVSDAYSKCFICLFLLHLNVSEVDMCAAHGMGCAWEAGGSTSGLAAQAMSETARACC
jgi:hypothetical protein